ncbi:MAG: FKBP-type peptidyl-prolyl cis-trans isomerase [Nanoarchaeota archaeon]|nr:FKBP-type peptidyl-prolyl cis-trans isomerase [Nanoarchaeota archaeon]
MSKKVKKGDFVEIEYDGRLKEPEMLFDTTDEQKAKKEGIYSQNMVYGPVTICVGETQLLKGLDESLVDKEIGKEHEIVLGPEHAFGKKDVRMMKLVPANIFKQHGIKPMVGLQVNIDGTLGVIRTATGGRVIVDFNHPFAGKEVIYNVKITKRIDDKIEKVKAFLNLSLNVKPEAIKVDEKDGKKIINVDSAVHPELVQHVKEKLVRVLPEFKDAEIVTKKETKKEQTKKPEPEKEA